MQVQVNTDNNIQGEDLAPRVRTMVTQALERFGERITRVEAHLSDENGQKAGGDDKRCLLEARVAGLQPVAVSHHAETLQQAIDGALDKLKRAVESAIGRHDRQ
jgi:ribosome-associated translation inhibitor RaiA